MIKRVFYECLLFLAILMCMASCCVMFCGCQSTTDRLAESASNKNVDINGYVMLGEIEMANAQTATPQGKMIVGKVEYRSRKVGIPADQKVPTTGYFRATKSIGFFGTEEQVITYDFTTGSDADAKAAMEALEKKREAVEKTFADTAK